VKDDGTVGAATDGIPAFVDQAVLVATQKHEVLQTRLAAVRPVLDVMGVYEAMLGAAGEAAAVVTQTQGPPNRRRDCT